MSFYAALLFFIFGLFLNMVAAAEQVCKLDSIVATVPLTQFADNNDGTISDLKTGLMWAKCSEGQIWNNSTGDCDGYYYPGYFSVYNWSSALSAIQDINGGGGRFGYVDWRLPNIKELNSIVERQCYKPAVNLVIFPNMTQNAVFWSSSQRLDTEDASGAQAFSFEYGHIWLVSKTLNFQIRLVRNIR